MTEKTWCGMEAAVTNAIRQHRIDTQSQTMINWKMPFSVLRSPFSVLRSPTY
ncbi:MAG: hypothetical protein LBU88_05375 [Treponema sp.]|nr:hypothetical protein [Treponema sp.]